MRDAVGNKLQDGQMVFWKPAGLVAKVVSTYDGMLQLHSKNGEVGRRPASITLQVVLPIPPQTPRMGHEAVLAELIRVVDPGAEAALGQLMEEGQTRQ